MHATPLSPPSFSRADERVPRQWLLWQATQSREPSESDWWNLRQRTPSDALEPEQEGRDPRPSCFHTLQRHECVNENRTDDDEDEEDDESAAGFPARPQNHNTCEIPNPPVRPLRFQNTCDVIPKGPSTYRRDSRIAPINDPAAGSYRIPYHSALTSESEREGKTLYPGTATYQQSNSSHPAGTFHTGAPGVPSTSSEHPESSIDFKQEADRNARCDFADQKSHSSGLTLPLRSRQLKPDSYIIQNAMQRRQKEQRPLSNVPTQLTHVPTAQTHPVDSATSLKSGDDCRAPVVPAPRFSNPDSPPQACGLFKGESFSKDAHTCLPAMPQYKGVASSSGPVPSSIVSNAFPSPGPQSSAFPGSPPELPKSVSYYRNPLTHQCQMYQPEEPSTTIRPSDSRVTTSSRSHLQDVRPTRSIAMRSGASLRSRSQEDTSHVCRHEVPNFTPPPMSRVETEGPSKPLDSEYCRALLDKTNFGENLLKAESQKYQICPSPEPPQQPVPDKQPSCAASIAPPSFPLAGDPHFKTDPFAGTDPFATAGPTNKGSSALKSTYESCLGSDEAAAASRWLRPVPERNSSASCHAPQQSHMSSMPPNSPGDPQPSEPSGVSLSHMPQKCSCGEAAPTFGTGLSIRDSARDPPPRDTCMRPSLPAEPANSRPQEDQGGCRIRDSVAMRENIRDARDTGRGREVSCPLHDGAALRQGAPLRDSNALRDSAVVRESRDIGGARDSTALRESASLREGAALRGSLRASVRDNATNGLRASIHGSAALHESASLRASAAVRDGVASIRDTAALRESANAVLRDSANLRESIAARDNAPRDNTQRDTALRDTAMHDPIPRFNVADARSGGGCQCDAGRDPPQHSATTDQASYYLLIGFDKKGGMAATGMARSHVREPMAEGIVPLVSRRILDENDAFIFDMDGVLWKGGQAIDGAPEALQFLQNQGKKVYFCTNNSASTRSQFQEKLSKMGFGQFDVDQILCTSWASAELLRQRNVQGKVLVLGGDGLMETIDALPGVQVLNLVDRKINQADFHCDIDPGIKAVVCGFDPHNSYYRLAYATCVLREIPDALFLITNEDINYPAANNRVLPGNGSQVQSLISATGREPIWCGKPQPLMAQILIAKHNLTASRVCMVGDNLKTDIPFGNKASLNTLLVETGMHTRGNCSTGGNGRTALQPTPSVTAPTCAVNNNPCRGGAADPQRLEQIKERRRREKEALRERRRIEREQSYERMMRVKEEEDQRRRQLRADIAQRILQLKAEEERIREKLRQDKVELKDRHRRDREASQERRCKLEGELMAIEERLMQEREKQREAERRERELLRSMKKQETCEVRDLERRFREESLARRARLRREKEELEERLRREKEELQMRFEYLEKKAEERVRQEKTELAAVQRHRRSESQERLVQSKREVEDNIKVLEEQLVKIEQAMKAEDECMREKLREEKERLEQHIEAELQEFQRRSREELEALNERRRRVREESQERKRRLRQASQERRERLEVERCEVREIHEAEKEATAESMRTIQLEKFERERLAQREEELRSKKAEIDATLECIRQQRDQSVDRAGRFSQEADERRKRLLQGGKCEVLEEATEELVEEVEETIVKEVELIAEKMVAEVGGCEDETNRYVELLSQVTLLKLDEVVAPWRAFRAYLALRRAAADAEVSAPAAPSAQAELDPACVQEPKYILPSIADIRSGC